jgi:putative methyltransferase (TIGR04325 family)
VYQSAALPLKIGFLGIEQSGGALYKPQVLSFRGRWLMLSFNGILEISPQDLGKRGFMTIRNIQSFFKRVLSRILRGMKILPSQTHLEYSGPFETWNSAVNSSIGYESKVVLEKVTNGVLDVLSGKAKYERDGTTFTTLPKSDTAREILWELIHENFVIIDFGGGLGGNYIANREFFEKANVFYYVLEQVNFVKTGQEIALKFELPINFKVHIEEVKDKKIDILLLSSVLQYLDDWQGILESLLFRQPKYIIIDRTPLSDGPTQIFVQENEGYYETKVSYPARILNRTEMLREFINYEVVREWKSDFDPENHFGFLLVKVA